MKRTMPAYDGAVSLVHRLRAKGAEVWLTTTRPWERFDRVDPDTREWLKRNRIEFDALLFHENKMAELMDRVNPERVCAVLDDDVEVLTEASSRFGAVVPILRRQMYNRSVDWPSVADDLSVAYHEINERTRKWGEYYG